MAVRASMAVLISRLRTMINDPAGASAAWVDEDLQDALDVRRREYRYAELRALETILPGGAVEFREYLADIGNWEEDAALTDGSFNALNPSGKDYLTGRWTFGANQKGPVYVTGKVYDLYGASADILDSWCARFTGDVDYTEGDVSYKLSQRSGNRKGLAERYRAKQWPGTAQMVRSDVA